MFLQLSVPEAVANSGTRSKSMVETPENRTRPEWLMSDEGVCVVKCASNDLEI